MRAKVYRWCLLLLALTAISACSFGATPVLSTLPTPTPQPKTVTITWGFWGDPWDVVGLPHKARRANVSAGAGYVITANTAQPEAAWTFLKFLSSFKVQAIIAESGVAIPALRSVAQSEVFMEQRPRHNALALLWMLWFPNSV